MSKTTGLGIFLLVGAVGTVGAGLLDGNPATPDFAQIGAVVMQALGAFGLIKMADDKPKPTGLK